MFCVMVSSKSFDPEKEDKKLLSEVELPAWMELDVLYLFGYSGLGDNSEFNTKISGSEMKMVEFASDSSLPS